MMRYPGKTMAIGLLSVFAVLCYLFTDSGPIPSRAEASSPESKVSARKPGGSFEADPYPIRVGEELYLKYCHVCHGESGEGNGFNAYILETQPRNFTDSIYMDALTDSRLAEAVSEGGRGVNKSVLMPAWGNTFSPLEISYLVRYIRQYSQTILSKKPAK